MSRTSKSGHIIGEQPLACRLWTGCKYLTAQRNIEGEITIDEAQELIKSYYKSKTNRELFQKLVVWRAKRTEEQSLTHQFVTR